MFKTLLRKQIAEIFHHLLFKSSASKKRSRAAAIGLICLFLIGLGGLLCCLFGAVAFAAGTLLIRFGLDWFYFALMSALALLVGIFGSAFSTYSGLYLGKDNDLLLSLPIPVSAILGARLSGVYLMGLFYCGSVMFPTLIVYWFLKVPTLSAVLGGLVLFLLVSVLVLLFSCLLGWLIAKISLKLKNKSLITVFISLTCFGLYMLFVNRLEEIMQSLVSNLLFWGQNLQRSLRVIQVWGSVGTGNPESIILCTAVVGLLAGLAWLLLSKTFLHMTIATGKTERHVYRQKKAVRRSVAKALLVKEFKRFFASAGYMLNAGFGVVMIPLLGAFLLIKGQTVLAEFVPLLGAGFYEEIAVFLYAVLCMIAATVNPVTSSVSLESKTLWLLQSLPVSAWDILLAKMRMQWILLGLSLLPGSLCLMALLHFSPVSLLLPPLLAGFSILSTLLGLFFGLKKPVLNWTNELTVIKQSAAVAFSMFSGWLYALAVGGIYILCRTKISAALYLGLAGAATLLLSYLLYRWVKTRGCKIFAAL